MKQLFQLLALIILLNLELINAQENKREHILLDNGWKFAPGHATDLAKDFNNRTGYFSYFAKAGYGDGAAAANFDDRAWRKLDLPHDWCVELPFSQNGSYSHGFKAMGKNFPENSVGWYRKSFQIPQSDLGKKISIEFEGVYRNSVVWVNGFYLGTELSGYNGFSYDISDYLNYGGDNVIAVRVEAYMEEGWYYEGAGIYRHVWLSKTSPLHVARYGTFVTTELKDNSAIIKVRTTVKNESDKKISFDIAENIINSDGKSLANGEQKRLDIQPGQEKEYISSYTIENPVLWSIENPYLHQLQTIIKVNDATVDNYNTTFGIRTLKFDPNEGFFLNGKHVKILGTNIHQDHAGVGYAQPDALFEFRIKKLKEMGSNAIRTSHDPPSPAFLDACDRLGMLVLDENRLMGSNTEHFRLLKDLMKRDRNHPAVVLWSLGNEEWAIEGNIKGARIAKTMQDYAQQFDSTRAFTAACSGGWEGGIGTVTQVMGYNYIVQGNIDEHHKKFPWQSGIGTEESNTVGTRGIYETNGTLCHLAATNRMPENVGTESGWQFYAARPFLAGVFYWTGFDYRGEPTPYGWPAISSQFGIIDLCGYPKDIFYYLKSWWGNDPVLHISTHWNWKGQEGKEKKVTIYSNCEQVELYLNNRKIGKKEMPVNGHLDWSVAYQPGTLMAKGYTKGKPAITEKIETTDLAANIQLSADKNIIKANELDVSVIKVQVNDSKNRMVPLADNEIEFSIEGPVKIIGVGNGDPSSHEPDRYFETINTAQIKDLKEFPVDNLENRPEVTAGFDDSKWIKAFPKQADWKTYKDPQIIVRGTFELTDFIGESIINLFSKSIVENQSIYINGILVASNIQRNDNQEFKLDHKILKPGKNDYAITGQRFKLKYQWDEPNTDPGLLQIITPAQTWKRKVFSGLAQIIVQSTGQKGEIKLIAKSNGLKTAEIIIKNE